MTYKKRMSAILIHNSSFDFVTQFLSINALTFPFHSAIFSV